MLPEGEKVGPSLRGAGEPHLRRVQENGEKSKNLELRGSGTPWSSSGYSRYAALPDAEREAERALRG